MSTEIETVDLYGINSEGIQVHLGSANMPPKMKAKEIVQVYFGHEDEDLRDMAMICCEELISWMLKQGWTCPVTVTK